MVFYFKHDTRIPVRGEHNELVSEDERNRVLMSALPGCPLWSWALGKVGCGVSGGIQNAPT